MRSVKQSDGLDLRPGPRGVTGLAMLVWLCACGSSGQDEAHAPGGSGRTGTADSSARGSVAGTAGSVSARVDAATTDDRTLPDSGTSVGEDQSANAGGEGADDPSNRDAGPVRQSGSAGGTDANSGSGGDRVAAHGGSGGAPAPAPAPGDDDAPGRVRYLGRVDASDPTAVELAWQGAGVSAIVSGSEIAVKLRTVDTDTVYFQSELDGAPGSRFEVRSGADRSVSIATGLDAGEHRIDIYRDTEGTFGSSAFLGFTSGTVLRPTPAATRRIEVVGDSISAGYGDLGYEVHLDGVPDPECKGTPQNSSWYQTYAAIAGRAFGAEVSTIAHQGWGMYRSNTGDTSQVLPAVYDNTLGLLDAPKWTFSDPPSVVVINLGTNDWAGSNPGMPFETAYLAFLDHVRGHYPDAWLFLTFGSMFQDDGVVQVDDRLASVVATRRAAGDDKITSFDLGSEDLGANGEVPTGCDSHPNVADHRRMARLLQQQLQSKLGW